MNIDLSYTAIWPYVMVILEPYGEILGILAGILVASVLLGVFIRRVSA